MNKLALLGALRQAMSDPTRIGDVPVLKSELGKTRAYPHVEALLASVRGYHPPVDVPSLALQPPGTFGHEYALFLRQNKLSPIVITGNLPVEMVHRNAFVVRYGIIHDMVHVLLGFDTSWPGEIGVWSFVGAQRYSFAFRIAGLMALLVAPLRCPLQLGRAWRAWKRGRQLAQNATLLIAVRLEEHLGEDLHEVRAALGIQL